MKNKLIIKNFYDELCEKIKEINFSEPVAAFFNPLIYAADGVEKYLNFSEGSKRVIFLGMNPGPYGMAQTGVPFGEVEAVKNFLGIKEIKIILPLQNNIFKISGLDCPRSEVSGKRLWGLFKERFETAENFFRENFVLNYCPLLFLAKSGEKKFRNLTPDKLKKIEREKLFEVCNFYLKKIIEVLSPEYVVGVGNFAEERAKESLAGTKIKITKILHPSPASPQSNKNWAEKVTKQLKISGIWS